MTSLEAHEAVGGADGPARPLPGPLQGRIRAASAAVGADSREASRSRGREGTEPALDMGHHARESTSQSQVKGLVVSAGLDVQRYGI